VSSGEPGAGWVALEAPVRAALRTLARGIEPVPAPALARVLVAGREARDPARYLALLGDLPRARWPELPGARVEIELRFEPRGPWDETRLTYYPDHGLLQRGDELVALPSGLRSLIAADAGLEPRPASASPAHSRGTWPAIVGSVVAALLLGVVVLTLGRLRRPLPR
jgi:hypothetical protein